MTPTDAMHKAAVLNHAAHSTGPMMECAEPECVTLRALPDDAHLFTPDSLAAALGRTFHSFCKFDEKVCAKGHRHAAATIIRAAKEAERE